MTLPAFIWCALILVAAATGRAVTPEESDARRRIDARVSGASDPTYYRAEHGAAVWTLASRALAGGVT